MIFHFFNHLYLKNFLGRNVTSHYHNSEIACTVKRPLMVISPQQPPLYNGHFFGGQSIHSLLFQPLYSGHFFLTPRWQLYRG